MLDIISCSRRTDIPAFYYGWLQEALKNKSVQVRNPCNNSSYTVDLAPEKVHSICLWSKSFAKVLEDPGYLSLYDLFFQFTVTGYSKSLEPWVISTGDALRQMEMLAVKYSPEQVNWRFDPVIFSSCGEQGTKSGDAARDRLKVFEDLCRDVSSFGIRRCTISFMYMYKKAEQRLRSAGIDYLNPSENMCADFAQMLAEKAERYGVVIYSCSNPVLEKVPSIKKSHCIDGPYLEKLFGKKASHAKDTGQRGGCGCTKSRDIGSYGIQPCGHGCLYCYANR